MKLSSLISVFVPFSPIESGATPTTYSHWYKCASSIKALIAALNIAELTASTIPIRKQSWNRSPLSSGGVLLSGGQQTRRSVANLSDEIGHAVAVTALTPSNQDYESTTELQTLLHWRQSIRNTLIGQPLASGIAYDTDVLPGPVVAPEAFGRQYDATQLTAICKSRGATTGTTGTVRAASAGSVFWDCLADVQTVVRDADISGLTDANVIVRKLPWVRGADIPGVIISPVDDRWRWINNTQIEVTYGIHIAIVQAGNQSQTSSHDAIIYQRQQAVDALADDRLASVDEIVDLAIEPSGLILSEAFRRQYDVSAFVARCVSRETISV